MGIGEQFEFEKTGRIDPEGGRKMTDQIKFEPDKFIVINRKHVEQTKRKLRKGAIQTCIDNLLFILTCDKNEPWPDNKYLVINQDEPYADKILEIILQGERDKYNDWKIELYDLSEKRKVHLSTDDEEVLYNNYKKGVTPSDFLDPNSIPW